MDYIELVFLGVLFSGIGFLFGKYLIPTGYRTAYAIACVIYGLVVIVFLDIDLNFPLNTSTTNDKSQLVSYWLVIVRLSGKFIFIGAIVSASEKAKEIET